MNKAAQRAFQGAIVHTRPEELERSLVPVPLHALPPPEVVGFRLEGEPELAMRVLWMSPDRCKAVTVERCGRGKLIVCYPKEASYFHLFYFMKGHCTQTRTDGTTDDWRAGDFVCFTEGQYVESVIHETFLKVACYTSTQPLPFEVMP